MIRIKFNILIGMLCFLLSSCVIGEDNGGGKDAPGQVDVTFSVTLPQPEVVNTRVGLPYSDADIKTVDVLVFDQQRRFMERIKVDEPALVSTGLGGVKFTIRLNATSDSRTIHMVANGRTVGGGTDRVNFRDIAAGADEGSVLPSLYTEVLQPENGMMADIMPLVMWGRTELNGVSAVSGASIKLLRVAASVNVKTANPTFENGLFDFQIKKIAMTGAAGHGYLTPDNGYHDVSTPNYPRPLTDGVFWGTDQTWSNEGVLTLYTYERSYQNTNYIGLFLSAEYKGQPGFYKVALVTGDGFLLNIVRNHRYTLTVTKVSGPGYADIQTAINSAPSNAIKITLTDEDEDFPCLVADGQHLMGLSNNSFVMYGNNTNRVVLGTVYSSRGVTPVPTMPAGASDWLKNLNAYAIGGNQYEISANFQNGGGQSHSTTLALTCDNLEQTMQVDWVPPVSDNKDTDSYVVTLFGTLDKNWTANVVTNESDLKGVFLSSVTSNPADFAPASGSGLDKMVFSLNSIYASNAYLHLAADGKGKGVVKVSTSVNGVAISRRIVIAIPQGN